ncbi:UNVERIFIED_CONTAM: hypothetical protein RMT77_017167 [Armadillidium vulgare]
MDLRGVLFGCLCIAACFGLGESQNFGIFFDGIGRSIVGFIRSGINNLKRIQYWFFPSKNFKNENLKSEEKSISTDDLFHGLHDVWRGKKEYPEGEIEKTSAAPSDDVWRRKNQNFVAVEEKISPTVSDDDSREEQLIYEPQNFNEIVIHDVIEKANLKSVEIDPSDASVNSWIRIKSIIENMKSLFKKTYGEDTNEKNEILEMIDKMIIIGDKINLVKNIEDSFDKDLLNFLYEKWSNIQDSVLKSNPLLKTMLTLDGKVLLLSIARGLVRQFGKAFHQQALVHLNEQEFIINTMRSSGFQDSEIYDVFKLLDLPTKLLLQTTQNITKSETVEGRGFFKFGGMFGHGGGHGNTGGYGSMMKSDPLILLAGLAFATFAAYLCYRLLSSTPPVEKRGFDGSSLSLYLSDIPVMMTNLHTWIEGSEQRYEAPEDLPETSIDNFIASINNLWRSYKKDTVSKSCIKRYLCYYTQENPLKTIQFGTNFNQLTLLTLAHLLGAKTSSKESDIYVQKLTNGQMVNCEKEAPACDNSLFNSIFKNYKRKAV